MRVQAVLAVTALSLLTLAGCGRHRKHAVASGPPPAFPGSYAQSCNTITTLGGGLISAQCADKGGHFKLSYIQASACMGDLSNTDGMLTCQGATATTTAPENPAAASSTKP